MTLLERFWAKVDVGGPDDCWVWTAARTTAGYGQLSAGFAGKPQTLLAHRFSYEIAAGPVPDGLHLDHLCRVRHCVNPAHLEPVTIRDNLMRGETLAAANRAKTECPKGHPYDALNTRIRPDGARACRTCGRANWQRWDAARRALAEAPVAPTLEGMRS